ncbi:hypothetical protein TNCV_2181871 [Trichonephila clavipes]|uniref:Uncharacterized protein n=1 Tax=Trichonephila clavipes TaxID=2585209 RepID=A0A8X6VV18_TRICX|nr:hypothetical protein TNCV_2181871 [Trichonephila clavipes]
MKLLQELIKTLQIIINSKPSWVSIDRVKPAFVSQDFDFPRAPKINTVLKDITTSPKTVSKGQKQFSSSSKCLPSTTSTRTRSGRQNIKRDPHRIFLQKKRKIASRINMEEEAEKFYIIKGLKENRSIEIQLQSCSNIEELKEKMKLLDIQEKSKPNRNEVIYLKYLMTRIPYHTNQFAHRQQYGGWNWRSDQSQHPNTITGSIYNVYSSQLPSPY